MQLRTNIDAVIARVERLQQGMPEVVARAAAPEFWRARLEHVAAKTLRAQWALERDLTKRAMYERLTPRILSTLTARRVGGITEIALASPDELAQQLGIEAAIDYNLGQRTPAGRTKKYAIQEAASEQNLQDIRDTIRDWVRLEKNRDVQRDYHADGSPLSEDELVERIEEILGVSDRSVPRDRTPAMDEAARSLASAIQRWTAGDGESPPVNRPTTVVVPPEVLAQWFAAVMLAWRAYVQLHLRERISDELTKLHERLKTQLL